MKQVLIAAALLAASPLAGHAATFQFFATQAEFDAAAGTAVAFDLTDTASPLTITGDDVAIFGNTLFDRIDQDDAADTVFDFGQSLFGFGGNFDLSAVGAGSGIALAVTTVDGIIEVTQELSPFASGEFFGFITDFAFDQVLLSEGSRASRPAETFSATNFVGSTSPAIAPVPLPAGLPLLMAALGSIAVLRRKTRAGAHTA